LVGDVPVISHERAVPDQVSRTTEASEVSRGEQGVDALAVTDRGRSGHAGLRMTKGVARRLELPFPLLRTRGGIERENVQPALLISAAGREVDALAGHDRTGDAPTRQINLPADVLGGAPARRQTGLGGNPRAARATKLWPIRGDEERTEQTEGEDASRVFP